MIFLPFLDASVSYRGSVRRLVSWSIRPSISPLQKMRFTDVFSHGETVLNPVLNQIIDNHVTRASFATLSFHLSVCPSVPPYMTHVTRHSQYAWGHNPDASLPCRACLHFSMDQIRPDCSVYMLTFTLDI